MSGLISVIISTYNWPQALQACLDSLLAQNDQFFEIIVADDGSGDQTAELVGRIINSSTIKIRRIHHEDRGFRAGTIRNKAVAVSQGDYLLFMDGDCVAFPNFISRHRQLSENGYFVPGNRILLSQNFTSQILEQKTALHCKPFSFFVQQRIFGNINRLLPLVYVPLNFLRYRLSQHWQKAMTCNLGIWKQDFLSINGFDEQFEGWGFEDSDLVVRLIHQGVKRKEGRFAVPVLHLWHPINDRSQHDSNYQRLMERVNNPDFKHCQLGVDQYL
jgi:glycosyltransferase involved in cell wall biosynthesis